MPSTKLKKKKKNHTYLCMCARLSVFLILMLEQIKGLCESRLGPGQGVSQTRTETLCLTNPAPTSGSLEARYCFLPLCPCISYSLYLMASCLLHFHEFNSTQTLPPPGSSPHPHPGKAGVGLLLCSHSTLCRHLSGRCTHGN